MEKSNHTSTPPLTFDLVWDVYEEMICLNHLMFVTMALVSVNFMSRENGCKNGGTIEEILQQLKAGYDVAEAYYKRKNSCM